MIKISFQHDVLPLKNQLFRLAQRITLNREEAEDIVQETLIKVWNRRNSWQDIESIEAFAMTICRNLALDSQRRQARRKESENENVLENHIDTALGPYEQMQQRDRVRIVGEIINSLPEKQRSCIQLRDIEGKTYKEISTVLAISEDQVKVNIFRARQTVREKLKTIDKYGL